MRHSTCLAFPTSVTLTFALVVAAAASAEAPPTPAAEPARLERQRVLEVSAEEGWIRLCDDATGCAPDERRTLIAATEPTKALLATVARNDLVRARWTPARDGVEAQLVDLSPECVLLSFPRRLGWFAGSAGLVLLLGWLVAPPREDAGSPRRGLRGLVVGVDGRYSNSKVQIAIWSFVLGISYVGTLALRWWAMGTGLGPAITVPQNVLLLSGFSALSFAGAKLITQRRVDAATLEWGPTAADVVKPPAESLPSLASDLGSDDKGRTDLGDLQMIVVTVLASGIYLAQAFAATGRLELVSSAATLPDVDGALLAIFGFGQGSYLAKKAVGGENQ